MSIGEFKMENEKLSQFEKRVFLLSLSQLSNILNFSKLESKNGNTYHIVSKDKQINMSFDFINYTDITSCLIDVISFVYTEYDFALNNKILTDYDILVAITKLNNGLIKFKILDENTFYDNHPLWYGQYSKIASNLSIGRAEAMNCLYSEKNISKDEENAFLLVKYFIDNILSEIYYLDPLEVIDFLRSTLALKEFLPDFLPDFNEDEIASCKTLGKLAKLKNIPDT